MSDPMISIGELARRAGVAASALRFYEAEGLITSVRSAGGRRHYPRSELRRVAFIRAAQAVGLSLDDVRSALASLPDRRTPTKEDWERLSRSWRPILDERIAAMTRLRDATRRGRAVSDGRRREVGDGVGEVRKFSRQR